MDPAAPVYAEVIDIHVPNETIDLRLDRGGMNDPGGGRNLFYVSEPAGVLSIYTTDRDSKIVKRINENDTSLGAAKKCVSPHSKRILQRTTYGWLRPMQNRRHTSSMNLPQYAIMT